jgi:hypothetical protein
MVKHTIRGWPNFEIIRIFQLFQQDTVGVWIWLQEERAGARVRKTEVAVFFELDGEMNR